MPLRSAGRELAHNFPSQYNFPLKKETNKKRDYMYVDYDICMPTEGVENLIKTVKNTPFSKSISNFIMAKERSLSKVQPYCRYLFHRFAQITWNKLLLRRNF